MDSAALAKMTEGGDLSAFAVVQNAALDRLMALPERQQLELWGTLPAPAVGDLSGEYVGLKSLEDQDAESWRRLHETFWNPVGHLGFWIGKALRPTSDTEGEGYNCWSRIGGRIRRFHRFSTFVAPSLIDQKPSLHLRYSTFKNQAADTDLVDELRAFGDEIFVGAATRRAADGGRTSPTAFLLTGPGVPWRGVDAPGLEG